MALFDYKCQHCDTLAEVLVRNGSPKAKVPCDVCGADADRVEFSSSSFSLVGGSWFKDGYR